MFGGLFAEPEDPRGQEDAYRFAQLSGSPYYRQEEMRMREGENLARAGVERAVGAFTGGPKREQAAAALRALAQTMKPGTKEFYAQAAAILSQHGMVEEAAQMQAKHDEAVEKERRALEAEMGIGSTAGDIARLQKQRDVLQKRFDAGDARVKPALDAIDRELAAKGTQRTGSTAASPEIVTLLNEQAKYAPGTPQYVAIQKRIDALGYKKGMDGEGEAVDKSLIPGTAEWKRRKDVEDREAKATAKEEQLDQQTQGKAKLGLKRARDIAKFARRAESLISGISTGVPGVISQLIPQSDANKLLRTLESIKANIGFDELQAMREAAKTGGALGQVSDFENRMLQATRGSLELDQGPDQLRTNVVDIRRAAEQVIAALGPAIGDSPNVGYTAADTPPALGKPAAPAGQPAAGGKRKFKFEQVK